MNQALALHQAGQVDAAEPIYRQVLAVDPDNLGALNLLGAASHQKGRLDEAARLLGRAVQLGGHIAMLHGNLGAVMSDLGRLDEALACFSRALEIDPRNSDAFFNRGNTLAKLDRIPEAIAAYEAAIAANPANAGACYNLGNQFTALGRLADAEDMLRRAVELNPNYTDAIFNLGQVLSNRGKLDEATGFMHRGLALNPRSAEGLNNLGCILNDKGIGAEGIEYFKKALEVAPTMSRAYSNLLMAMHYVPGVTNQHMLEAARHFMDYVPAQEAGAVAFTNSRDPDRAIRIGFVSGDFYTHPIGHFLASVLEARDRARFQVYCYSNNAYADDVTARLKAASDQWRMIDALSDADALGLIRADAIDILIDLSGHTAKNRLPLFALRPAPVQASWIGYFGTTGVPQVDYLLMDPVSVRDGEERFYTETVIRLEAGRFCYTPPSYAPEVAPPPVLSRGTITFGSFNNLNKLKPPVIALWAEVIKAVPDSRLLLKWKSLTEDGTRQTILDAFAAHGVAADRIELRGASPHAQMLAEYGDVDIALDPFPYCGGLTSCEALWMGVPVITYPAEFPVSRQTEGFLEMLGLSDLVAFDPHQYVENARRLAADPARIAAIRESLRHRLRATPLIDAGRFARILEAALAGMWRAWCDGSGRAAPVAAPVAAPSPPPPPLPPPQPEPPKQPQGILLALRRDGSFGPPVGDVGPGPRIRLVSASRAAQDEFLASKALGRSLPLFRFRPGIELLLFAGNSTGLPTLYNAAIEHARTSPAILVFIHDDVHLTDFHWTDKIEQALERFDLIGLAGNRRRVPRQPSWAFVDDRLTWDERSNLSGRVGHGTGFPCDNIADFGPTGVACKLLDGVLLAARSQRLIESGLRFDESFAFHFYDLDVCRRAEQLGLSMGTWGVDVIHESGGAFGTASWREGYGRYLAKWGE
jgi:predicted O-linked N-acetylglucosamine transferase (SPINDLY family)